MYTWTIKSHQSRFSQWRKLLYSRWMIACVINFGIFYSFPLFIESLHNFYVNVIHYKCMYIWSIINLWEFNVGSLCFIARKDWCNKSYKCQMSFRICFAIWKLSWLYKFHLAKYLFVYYMQAEETGVFGAKWEVFPPPIITVIALYWWSYKGFYSSVPI